MSAHLPRSVAPAVTSDTEILHRLDTLNAIGVALSTERDLPTLLERILEAARGFADADGGTLYRVDGDTLRFEVLRNDTLGAVMGGRSGAPIPFAPLPLHLPDGSGNHAMVVAHAALTGTTVNIDDAYAAEGYDFSGTRAFDARTGYRSQSFLTVPMKDHDGGVIGVLQLINAKDPDGTVRPFGTADQHLVESLASQAAIALNNRQLIEQLETLFEALISLINTAIDEKSPYTGGHCERVPALTTLLADAVARTRVGPLADFTMSEADRYELKIAGLLHDCGKITTPVHVVDKATKLQTLFDRIELLDTRFEVRLRDAEIAHLRNVPEYAGGHHERMDGKGYPKGLTREQMSVQARVMGIADIFEALTASDRPYKSGKTLTESLTILGRMKLEHHVDPDLFDVFLRERVYLEYARRFLPPEQIDRIDWAKIPGVSPELAAELAASEPAA